MEEKLIGSHYSRSKDNSGSIILLTLIFPFAGLLYSLVRWRESWAKNVFWLACVYMGAVFVFFPEGTIFGQGADGGRYAMWLQEMYNSNITLSYIFSNFRVDSHIMDLYQPLLTYLVSRITDNGHVLFAVFAFVFGFFYSRNIWYVLDRLPQKRLGNLVILFALFFLICPITQINGVRMWTALHVFVYAIMPYLLERDKSKFWWVLITPFIHFSFLYVSLFAIAYFFLPYSLKTQSKAFLFLVLSFFIVSMFVNALNLSVVSDTLAEYSPESYEDRITGYVNQDYADRIKESASLSNWYVTLSGSISHWVYAILLIIAYPYVLKNCQNRKWMSHLYGFSLLIGGFANIMAFIPSGGRFRLLSQMFIVAFILILAMLVEKNDVYRKCVNIASVFLLLPLVFGLRGLLDYFSVTLIAGNFITMFFVENNTLLIDYLKYII